MADPFEVRMRFTSQLQHLNASVTSAQKAAHYALKHREMDEDLHSCILEQLERNNMNNRANIMYFFEALCDRARAEQHPEFIRMMERDILRIIDLVAPAPETSSASSNANANASANGEAGGGGNGQTQHHSSGGAANVKVVRKVLHALQQKAYLNPQTVVELEECIKDRDVVGAGEEDSHEDRGGEKNGGFGGSRENPGGLDAHQGRKTDKRQIEQRIEEDRERHKRLRESIWAVDDAVGPDAEYWRMLEETSDVGEDDYAMAAEEAEERRRCAESHRLEVTGMAV